MNIALIGGGTMAESMIKGVLKSQILKPSNISIGEISPKRRKHLDQTYKVKSYSDNVSAIKSADIIILSIKPQNVLEVSKEISKHIPNVATIISIVAISIMI